MHERIVYLIQNEYSLHIHRMHVYMCVVWYEYFSLSVIIALKHIRIYFCAFLNVIAISS